ncbi:rhamnogalacturonan acetylesterase [Butyrivibrio sp. CB08]|uniref:rhamnogalacturonan acetylesterase n=1 Tax=Butyrivibrio sp. CB08 TaxID=2364879 RepID=UPI000EA9CD14|nr:rhamnogalacturonan acetylesterase [Butyrivibrio sp. CB08]RKM62342.1 rhamnogalacturonan acetylesterase [Butyrivibrio sp. CB08]
MRHIFWAGDSTVATNKYSTYPQTGIGQAFDRYTKADVVVVNHAVNGRSTKSFIDESRLATIYNDITKGDYLFIQFGHNDEKKQDPSRYTEPHGEFIENLGKFVNVARNKNAYPVFITSVERRLFYEDGKLKESEHTEYVKGMKEAGEKFDVPVVDLFTESRDFLEKTGDEASKKYYMNLEKGEASWAPEGKTDNSHLKYEGAMLYAGMIARAITKLGDPYKSLIADDVLLSQSMDIETNG